MPDPYASRASILSQDRKKVKTPPIRIPRPTQKMHKTCIYKHYESRRDLQHLHLDEHYAIIHKSLTESRRVMYDDYDFDYTYTNDYADLDEHYTQDLDEDYARDGQDYESLAYRHYA